MAERVTLIPGDGIGPEITAVTRACVDALDCGITWDLAEAGEPAIAKSGTPLPDATLEAVRRNGVALKGPITTPVGTGFRSVNVALRHHFGLYACLRPIKLYPGARSRYPEIDLVVVRENMEDLYAGIEFETGTPAAAEVAEVVSRLAGKRIAEDAGISIKPITVRNTERIVKFAFEYAVRHGRKKVTAVHKANIMKFTDGLFLSVARKVAGGYPGVAFEDRIVDNMAMQLVQKPELYDVLVCPNLYGDIISDLCAGLIGGLGVAPGGNIGDGVAVFEPTHGSAPKYAGRDKVNPCAMILAAVLMLEHLGKDSAARRLEAAVAAVIAAGRKVTYDFLEPGDAAAVGTAEMGRAIIEKIRAA